MDANTPAIVMNLGKLCIRSDLSARHALNASNNSCVSLSWSSLILLSDDLSLSTSSNLEMINSFYDKFIFEVTGMCANITDNLALFDVYLNYCAPFWHFSGEVRTWCWMWFENGVRSVDG